jgi:hypothetical protein
MHSSRSPRLWSLFVVLSQLGLCSLLRLLMARNRRARNRRDQRHERRVLLLLVDVPEAQWPHLLGALSRLEHEGSRRHSEMAATHGMLPSDELTIPGGRS